jgi:hypothetical protein
MQILVIPSLGQPPVSLAVQETIHILGPALTDFQAVDHLFPKSTIQVVPRPPLFVLPQAVKASPEIAAHISILPSRHLSPFPVQSMTQVSQSARQSSFQLPLPVATEITPIYGPALTDFQALNLLFPKPTLLPAPKRPEFVSLPAAIAPAPLVQYI